MTVSIVLVLIGILGMAYFGRGMMKRRDTPDAMTMGHTSHESGSTFSSFEGPITISPRDVVIPKYCSNCGSSIDLELVEWVGPLQFRCPRCGHKMNAEARIEIV